MDSPIPEQKKRNMHLFAFRFRFRERQGLTTESLAHSRKKKKRILSPPRVQLPARLSKDSILSQAKERCHFHYLEDFLVDQA